MLVLFNDDDDVDNDVLVLLDVEVDVDEDVLLLVDVDVDVFKYTVTGRGLLLGFFSKSAFSPKPPLL